MNCWWKKLTHCAPSLFEQYDYSCGTFSPDGRIFQVEYAQKAVENSGWKQMDIASDYSNLEDSSSLKFLSYIHNFNNIQNRYRHQVSRWDCACGWKGFFIWIDVWFNAVTKTALTTFSPLHIFLSAYRFENACRWIEQEGLRCWLSCWNCCYWTQRRWKTARQQSQRRGSKLSRLIRPQSCSRHIN